MTPQKQLGDRDCFRASLATLLDLDISEVPDFIGDEDDGGEQWWIALGKWLSERDLAAVSIHEAVGHSLTVWRDLYHIASATGPRGHRHAVVGRLEADDEEIRWHLVFDPHPSDDGLADEVPDRFYFILPLDPSRCL